MSNMDITRANNRARAAKAADAAASGEAPRKNRRTSRTSVSTGFVGEVRPQSLADFAKRNMGLYATEVNLDRSVPDLFDGLKPVQRRILWEAFLQGTHRTVNGTKTARVVGQVVGRWHPHGDASVESSVTTLVQHPTPTMLGIGNWGGLLDPAAAMRYTACKLSHYGETFFHSDYIAKEVASFVLNYDDLEHEPVSLPAMLPNVLLNGGSGIGVGVTTSIPTFTPESVVAILSKLLAGEELGVTDYARTLKFNSKWGGHLVSSKANKEAWLTLMRTGNASLQFEADLVIDRDDKSITIDDWPPGLSPKRLIPKIRALPETNQVFNHKGKTGFKIEMRKDYNYTQFDAFVAKIKRMVISRTSYRINVTFRKAVESEGETEIQTRFLSMSVIKLLSAWLKVRLQYEKRSLEYRMRKQDQAIAYSKLLIFASSKLDVIFKALRVSDSRAYLVQHLDLTEEQADLILDLKVRQLSKLDADKLKVKLAEQQAFLKQLQAWYKAPKPKVRDDLQACLEAIRKDRNFEVRKGDKVEVV